MTMDNTAWFKAAIKARSTERAMDTIGEVLAAQERDRTEAGVRIARGRKTRLAVFMLARLDDDETAARNTGVQLNNDVPPYETNTVDNVRLVAVWPEDPWMRRVMTETDFLAEYGKPIPADPKTIADIETKRLIIDMYAHAAGITSGIIDPAEQLQHHILREVVQHLADVYRDHPDYPGR